MTEIAFLDFDNTLIKGHSLPLLFAELAGGRSLMTLIWHSEMHLDLFRYGIKGSLKRRLYRRLLAGRQLEEVAEAGTIAAEKLELFPRVLEALKRHHRAGHRLVIATASPRVYIERILDALEVPYHQVIGTELAQRGGRLTGEFIGGECIRHHKADRVRDYLSAHGPFENTAGYGNRPDDLPMLELLQQRHVVLGNGRLQTLSS